MITLENIIKTYKTSKNNTHHVLNKLDLKIKAGESIAIEGRSGSGKTTLLNIITGMSSNFSGNYQFEDMNMNKTSPATRAKFRQKKIGIITQKFDLLDDRNVYQNIALAISHQKLNRGEKKQRIAKVLAYVGLSGYEKKPIKQLSGGEMQRVGIARALAKQPKLIVADEPTGSLDEQTREEILDVFKKMIQDGTQFIIVTHDKEVSSICNQVYYIQDGVLVKKNNYTNKR